ncbi:MAG: heme ABC transporter ATP-binding protein, partial [Treponema sp.]|nr:heme ABC transporter ATP-binding protein [Treponema sp.]
REFNISLILITHDMHLMLEYTARAVVLSNGECAADKKPFEVLTDDLIIKKANLKRTSLYDLAVKAGIKDAQGFTDRYIRYDREKREKTQ